MSYANQKMSHILVEEVLHPQLGASYGSCYIKIKDSVCKEPSNIPNKIRGHLISQMVHELVFYYAIIYMLGHGSGL